MSEPEVILWTRLRGRGSGRPTFRRQHPIGSSIVDFYCPTARLVVEVDGSTDWTDEQQGKDLRRDRWLESQGFTVIRLPASMVFRDINGAMDWILSTAEALIERPAPAPRLAPSTVRSSADGPPPAASRGR